MKIIIIMNILLAIALCSQVWMFVKYRYKEMKRVADSRILHTGNNLHVQSRSSTVAETPPMRNDY